MSMMETINAGESETTEFKTSLAEWRDVVETISAFSNKNGGTIFIGVGDNCEIIGSDIGNKTIEDFYRTPLSKRWQTRSSRILIR